MILRTVRRLQLIQLQQSYRATSVNVKVPQRPRKSPSLSVATQQWREKSTNTTSSHALQYLETWVGTKPSNQSQSKSPLPNSTPSTIIVGPTTRMQVTGSSYLLPTIRLPKAISSSNELSAQLESFFDSSNRNTPHAIRSMLKPKAVVQEENNEKKFITWRVPIILDLKAFQHDGSPHYKPPPKGFLKSIVDVLDEWGIAVIGVTNIQQDENRDVYIVEEVVNLGLPVLMSKVGRTLGGTLNKNGSTDVNNAGADSKAKSYGIEELVQLVTKHMENGFTSSDQIESLVANKSMKSQNKVEGKNTNVNEVNNEKSFFQDTQTVTTSAETEDNEKRDIENEIETDETSIFLTKEDIETLSFRQLQKECKTRKLGAMGNSDVLRQRLLDELYPPSDERIEYMSAEKANEEFCGSEDFNSKSTVTAPIAAKVYKGNVRSGQQVTTDEPNQSLIIIGNVSSGGEVMSDGDIYVYGALRGRALAGLAKSNKSGGEDSKIFASRFDAELICIGDHFTTIDSISELGLKNTDGAMVSVDEKNQDLKFTKF